MRERDPVSSITMDASSSMVSSFGVPMLIGPVTASEVFMSRQNKLRIKIARIFNTYGPRMHPNDGRVVSNFIVQALLGRDITVFGDGLQTRSFCYVDDLTDGLVRQ
jgi:NAD dependent epimerase/dehydratase family